MSAIPVDVDDYVVQNIQLEEITSVLAVYNQKKEE